MTNSSYITEHHGNKISFFLPLTIVKYFHPFSKIPVVALIKSTSNRLHTFVNVLWKNDIQYISSKHCILHCIRVPFTSISIGTVSVMITLTKMSFSFADKYVLFLMLVTKLSVIISPITVQIDMQLRQRTSILNVIK
jgi:hypothetical protein